MQESCAVHPFVCLMWACKKLLLLVFLSVTCLSDGISFSVSMPMALLDRLFIRRYFLSRSRLLVPCSFFFLFFLLLTSLYHVLCVVWFLSVVVSAVQQYTSVPCATLLSCVEYWLWLAHLYPSWFCQRSDKKRVPFTVVHYGENPTGDRSEWCGFVVFHAGRRTLFAVSC